jgi:hypothetical protein
MLTFRVLSFGKGMPFRSMIRGKFLLSADYPAEKHAILQDNPRKVKPFHGL